jgi:uncharacterized protein with NRDE domain
MCLIVLAWRTHSRYRLIVAANRDEYFLRPAAPAGFWDDHPSVLAGRDLEAGGTWLGITLEGRFAALTNYRNPAEKRTGVPSRGALVSEFLTGKAAPREYVQEVEERGSEYNGFGLLVGDAGSMYFLSNRGGHAAGVEPGVHGLSNHLLDTPWPKVEKGKARLAAQLDRPFDAEAAFALLDDIERAPDGELPSTGVSLELLKRIVPRRGPQNRLSRTQLPRGRKRQRHGRLSPHLGARESSSIISKCGIPASRNSPPRSLKPKRR